MRGALAPSHHAAVAAVLLAVPLVTIAFSPWQLTAILVASASLLSLAGLGALAAQTAGASPVRGAARVTFWGALAMTVTSLIGRLFGAVV